MVSEEAYPTSLTRWLVLVVVIVGTFMAVLDITIVNVVLPKIMSSLGANVMQVKWVSTAFMISTAVSMPATGWLGRRFGLGRLYLAELLVFTVGSALCAVAWSLDVLVAARVIQALGAGGIMPTSMAIITDTFPPAERGRAIGIWGVGFMAGPAIGPTLGGYLTDWFNWRAVFAVNLPVGVAAMLLTALLLQGGGRNTSTAFDWKGFVSLGVFLVAGLLTLDNGQDEGWGSQIILLGMAITVMAMAIITDTFPPAERGRAIGIWGVGFMAGPAIGPTLGGYLTDWFNWRAVFAVNLPVGVAAMLLTALLLQGGGRNTSTAFDWKGFVSLGVFLVAGLLTLDNGQDEGWGSQIILLGMAITVMAFVLFLVLVWDAPTPVVPLGLFRSTEFSMTMLLSFIRSGGFFGSLFMLPIFLQNVQGRDTIDTGLMLIPGAVTVAVCMPIAGMVTDRFGPRWPTLLGILLMVYSLYLYNDLEKHA